MALFDRRDETVAPPRKRLDIPGFCSIVVERYPNLLNAVIETDLEINVGVVGTPDFAFDFLTSED